MRIPLDELLEVLESDENAAFCLACGEMHFGVEPDAREYECESCGENKVYGAQEIIIMGEFIE